MPKIFVLPEHIASQIAAGEVVERPASVIKELVENSIDSDASKIVIDISEGCRFIRVSDNGCGMEAADANLAFQRHATSKLSSANDLWNLHTLGFRGEALPSIAAVSKLTCLTRPEKAEVGTKVICMDGNMVIAETGCAKGTSIEVEELFYNVPARLSFLKKPATEFAHIYEIVQSLAITYPYISFELSLDKSLRLKTLGSGVLDESIRETNFFNEQKDFISLEAKDGILGLEIEGRLISPKSFRGDHKGIMTIVNKRPVRCALTYKALDYAYADLIPRGRYPLAVIHLKVVPNELDINIHPTKKEIRYARGNEVYLFLQRQIMNALRGSGQKEANEQLDFAPRPSFDQSITNHSTATSYTPDKFGKSFSQFYPQERSTQLSLKEASDTVYLDTATASGFGGTDLPIKTLGKENSFGNFDFNLATLSTANQTQPVATDIASDPNAALQLKEPSKSPSTALPLDWRLAGYIANTYFLIETNNGLFIIEQHIAHERVLYEKLLAAKKDEDIQSQNLIISLPLHLTNKQKCTLKENITELVKQGFEFEINGEVITCQQVPIELANKDYASIIQHMLEELNQNAKANPKLEIIKSIACQTAIKNGMPLANEQIIELLAQWYATPRNETCPHGRPIQLNFSFDKLFQMFHPK